MHCVHAFCLLQVKCVPQYASSRSPPTHFRSLTREPCPSSRIGRSLASDPAIEVPRDPQILDPLGVQHSLGLRHHRKRGAPSYLILINVRCDTVGLAAPWQMARSGGEWDSMSRHDQAARWTTASPQEWIALNRGSFGPGGLHKAISQRCKSNTHSRTPTGQCPATNTEAHGKASNLSMLLPLMTSSCICPLLHCTNTLGRNPTTK